MAYRFGAFRPRDADTGKARSGNPTEGEAGGGQGMMGWLKERVLAVALAAASTIAFLSLISPWWMDFMFDVIMVGLIAVVGKLVRRV
ncbi:MAG TPA: hypothetical protein VK602_15040 [Phyllobacterium sp.]|nr:hypothetical protein [Phyllobacterium sp.]